MEFLNDFNVAIGKLEGGEIKECSQVRRNKSRLRDEFIVDSG